jgi:DNA-binding transcriptional MerR regulator
MKDNISIGELSKRTGISVLRLRAWETRYGFPTAHLLESGHRRYDQEVVNRTVLIAQLLEKGFRIGKVIHLENEEMTRLLSEKSGEPILQGGEAHASFTELLEHILNFDEAQFTQYWENQIENLSTLEFLDNLVYPFLIDLGEKWENGVIGVSHEHFASNILEHIIERSWRQDNLGLRGDASVLALLPNEYHAFGLHFAASLCVAHGHKVVFLGERTPIDAIIESVDKLQAKRLIISVSETYDIRLSEKYLKSLFGRISRDVEFWVGGSGAPEIEGVVTIKTLKDLDQLLGTES